MAELEIGSIVADRYRLDRQLGEGGMGVVYAATHMKTRKVVALKILRPGVAKDAATKQRFLREARAACAVKHANVVEINDVIELDDEMPIIVMELLEGEPLAAKLAREKKIALPELARLLLPVVSAVGTAHELGIVHRDLKPDNIFLTRRRDGSIDVRVLDFGIAKLTATEGDAARSGAMTGTGAVLGTPYYMSPEQIFGEKDIDHRADVWALGVILYECIAGARPTQAENIGQIFKMVTTGKIPAIAKQAPDLDPQLAALVTRMLSRDRDGRPSDLREVATVLGRFTDVGVREFGAPPGTAAAVGEEAEGQAEEAPSNETAVVVTPRHGPESQKAVDALDDTVEEAKAGDARGSTQSPITVSRSERRRGWRVLPIVVAAAIVGVLGVSAVALRSGSRETGAVPTAGSAPGAAQAKTGATSAVGATADTGARAAAATDTEGAAAVPVPGVATTGTDTATTGTSTGTAPPNGAAVAGAQGTSSAKPRPQPPATQPAPQASHAAPSAVAAATSVPPAVTPAAAPTATAPTTAAAPATQAKPPPDPASYQ